MKSATNKLIGPCLGALVAGKQLLLQQPEVEFLHFRFVEVGGDVGLGCDASNSGYFLTGSRFLLQQLLVGPGGRKCVSEKRENDASASGN